MRRALAAPLFISLLGLGGCSGDASTLPRPNQFVLDMLGTWDYQATFSVQRVAEPSDTLNCVATDARLILAEPITDLPATGSYPGEVLCPVMPCVALQT